MKTKMLMIAALAMLAFAAPAAAATDGTKPAATGAAKPEITRFDAWDMRCLNTPKGKYCSLFQRASATVDGKKIMAVVAEIEFVKGKDGKKNPHLRLITPLGSWLPSGIGFKLDEEKQNKVPYLFCGRSGCMTDLTIETSFIDKMKKGKSIVVGYKLSDKKQVEGTISLKGFGGAFDALQKKG